MINIFELKSNIPDNTYYYNTSIKNASYQLFYNYGIFNLWWI